MTSQNIKQPKPQAEKYNDFLSGIKKGQIKIPQFQRDFVWDIEETANLLDSILKGYPIGTFILWKTRERMRSVKALGNISLPEVPEGDAAFYVLDGQQRMTSIFVGLQGLTIDRNNRKNDYSKIYVNLELPLDADGTIITADKPEGQKSIPLNTLLTSNLSLLTKEYLEYIDTIQNYRERFMTYDFSTIHLVDYSLEEAVEVFTRINTTGTELTLFEILAAKTYDESADFDLQRKYSDLNEELEEIGYDTLSNQVILQTIAINAIQDCTRKSILKLEKEQVHEFWEPTVSSIKEAVDYFRTFYRIPVSRLLPYTSLITPFSYFFFKNKNKPDQNQESLLEEFFWRLSLSARYSSGTEAKLAQDVKRIDQIIAGKRPKYSDYNVQTSADHLMNWSFSTGDSYSKAILCLYCYFEPKSFSNNATVILDNNWLKQSNSKNYHHFFPRAFLAKNKIENENCVLNITLVDDHLNKREIGAKAPSVYMKKFTERNPVITDTMRTHLIGDSNTFGITTDDYQKFLSARAELVSNELEKRINIY